MPLVSVITINYNNLEGLRRTMDSVLGQTFAGVEYIVVDGGSTDGSAELIKTHSHKLAWWVSEKDSGIYNAQNKGIRASKGKYLLFLNSGDFLCSRDVLEKAFAQEPEADIIYGNMQINWGNNSVSRGIMPDAITPEHLFRDTLWHPVSFIRRTLFDKLGLYNESYRLVADYEFFFRAIIVSKASTQRIDLDIAEYNTEGASSKPGNKQLELEERRRVHEAWLSREQVAELEKRTAMKKSIFTKLKELFK